MRADELKSVLRADNLAKEEKPTHADENGLVVRSGVDAAYAVIRGRANISLRPRLGQNWLRSLEKAHLDICDCSNLPTGQPRGE